MSSRIVVCPACNSIASMTDLPDEARVALVTDMVHADDWACVWKQRAYWCPACETPFLIAWPGDLSKEDRRELVGLPRDLVEIDEERRKK